MGSEKRHTSVLEKYMIFFEIVVYLICFCNPCKCKNDINMGWYFPCIKVLQHHDGIEAAVTYLRRTVSAVKRFVKCFCQKNGEFLELWI